MKQSDLDYFKELLLSRKEQIQKNINDAANEIDGLRQSGATDEFDFASISADEELEHSISIKQQQELNEIDQSLKKIDSGVYGICDMCEDDIDIERLKVKPHARYCITCREIAEKTIIK
ncbi:RNA polymerase-binding protein DksA [Campylobacter lanienae]|uniref:RNA polymerase-binding protein DksA n=1 Tax=Campylobacter lanienae TaxID=75658 RepID=UPI000BB44961|nr:RNA polymerase-binding protein DksA [Campylobacter lanienae]